jgi:UDP-N-acetylmuramyl pentapeptide phosphotransferase/UDP-N-acetylglucosamine-1-phosphate transferase
VPEGLILAAAAILGVTFGLGGTSLMIRRAAAGTTPVDLPDARRLHTRPTPRGGGIGFIFAGIVAGLLGVLVARDSVDRRMTLIVGIAWALPNGLMGWLDDYRPMRSRVKFALQAVFAVVAVALGLRLDALVIPPFLHLEVAAITWPFTILWLIWAANFYNFMDGMDALAGGGGLLFFLGFTLWTVGAGASGLGCLALGLAGASLGFLHHNRPPARIFMGDGGSLYIGAALGGLAVALARRDVAAVPIAASVLLLGTFVWDTTYTIVVRALRDSRCCPTARTSTSGSRSQAGPTAASGPSTFSGRSPSGGGARPPRAPAALQAALLGAALAACVAITVLAGRLEKGAR